MNIGSLPPNTQTIPNDVSQSDSQFKPSESKSNATETKGPDAQKKHEPEIFASYVAFFKKIDELSQKQVKNVSDFNCELSCKYKVGQSWKESVTKFISENIAFHPIKLNNAFDLISELVQTNFRSITDIRDICELLDCELYQPIPEANKKMQEDMDDKFNKRLDVLRSYKRQIMHKKISMTYKYDGQEQEVILLRKKFCQNKSCKTLGHTLHKLQKCICGISFYCDKKCQKADWSNHKVTCSTVKKTE